MGEWKHIDCLRLYARDHVHDPILQKLLYTGQTPRARPPATGNQSRAQAILDATDLDLMTEEQTVWKVADVPGGSISFLFERGIKSVTENDEVAQEEDI